MKNVLNAPWIFGREKTNVKWMENGASERARVSRPLPNPIDNRQYQADGDDGIRCNSSVYAIRLNNNSLLLRCDTIRRDAMSAQSKAFAFFNSQVL